jgi:thioredoxin 1
MPEINDLNYERFLADALIPVVLVFKASFCGPSAMIEPLLEDAVEEYSQAVIFADIDVEKCPNLTRAYQVKQTPTMILLSRAEPIASRLGTSTFEEFCAWLDKSLDKIAPKPEY